MKKVAVTGGSGIVGKWVLKEFIDYGYEVVNIDQKRPEQINCRTIITDLTNLGEVYGAIKGADAVVHLASINAPGGFPNEVVFQNNVISTYNVLEACSGMGIQKVAVASSESIYGFCWAEHRFSPDYFPVTEEHPLLPQECYGLSKIAAEEAAKMFQRRDGSQIVCLRFGHVAVPPAGYAKLLNPNNKERERFLWSYVDVRDAASACRLAVEAENLEFAAMNITADETCMEETSNELIRRYYPSVSDLRVDFSGNQALSSNRKAKKLLKWKPVYSWKNQAAEREM